MGNRIFGCDDCLAVCPWNKFARAAHEQRLQAREALRAPALGDLARLDEAGFRARFARTAIKRIGVARFLRNVLYAIGNSGDPSLIEAARPHLGGEDPVLADAAAWAIARLGRSGSNEQVGPVSKGAPPLSG
jgi:epoxyqueuosine reductase